MRILAVLLLVLISTSHAQWERVYAQPTIYDINFIHAFSKSHYLIATSGGEIFSTTNSGNNWERLFYDSTIRFLQGQFVDENTGFLLSSSKSIFKTTNGGINWTEYPTNILETNINKIYFLNSSTGILVFRSSAYKTYNGGETWISINLPDSSILASGTILDSNTIFLIGEDIIKTTNAGITWQKSPQIVPTYSLPYNAIIFKDSVTGYLSTYDFCIAKTTNQGETWTIDTLLYYDFCEVNDIKINGDTTVILGTLTFTSEDSFLVETTDNGRHWKRIDFQYPEPVLNSFSMLDNNHFVAAGNEGTGLSLKVMDNNYTFITRKQLFQFTHSMSFLNKNYGVFCNNYMVLRKTTDGGHSFCSIEMPIGYYQNIVACSEDTILLSSLQYLHRSTDGGVTWSREYHSSMDSSPFHRLKNSIYIYSGSNGLFKTTNAGESWGIVYPWGGYDADFIDDSLGWLVLFNGSIIKTTNGGSTWEQQAATYSNYISMADSSVGVTITQDGIAYYTTNGGKDWLLSSFVPPQYAFITNLKACIFNNGVRMYFSNTSENYPSESNYLYTSVDSGKTFFKELFVNDQIGSLDYSDNTLWLCTNYKFFLYKYEDITVPVELNSFTSSTNDNNVTLFWSTATEKNNYGFEIERKSLNNDYKRIGFIKGKGTTTEINNYSYTDKTLTPGLYMYRLKQIDQNGEYKYYNLPGEINIGHPAEYSLSQNYPNPFNPKTTIRYSIKDAGFVKIEIYDILGRKVTTIVNEERPAGNYEVNFNGNNLASGIYFYKLTSGSFTQIKKMQLLK